MRTVFALLLTLLVLSVTLGGCAPADEGTNNGPAAGQGKIESGGAGAEGSKPAETSAE